MSRKPINKTHYVEYPPASERYNLTDHVEYAKAKKSLIVELICFALFATFVFVTVWAYLASTGGAN